MNYIQIQNKSDFHKIVKSKKWKSYMWDLFKENTCYIPDEDCFISLEKAENGKYR